jgi:hypothetical protein
MAELREVFEMTTKQMDPDLDSWKDQERRQRQNRQRRKVGALAVAAAIGVAALVLILLTRPGEGAGPPASGSATPSVGSVVDPSAVQVTTGFVEAYGSFDAPGAIGYLADGASVEPVAGAFGVGTTTKQWPLNLSWWKATGYKQRLHSCQVMGVSSLGTNVRCTLDYSNFGADQIGRGPFRGSYWDLTVLDGKIVSASQYCEIAKFSPQMWEPFSRWVSTTYPKDAKVMFANHFSDYRLNPESIQLWGQHLKDYVKAVKQGTAK